MGKLEQRIKELTVSNEKLSAQVAALKSKNEEQQQITSNERPVTPEREQPKRGSPGIPPRGTGRPRARPRGAPRGGRGAPVSRGAVPRPAGSPPGPTGAPGVTQNRPPMESNNEVVQRQNRGGTFSKPPGPQGKPIQRKLTRIPE